MTTRPTVVRQSELLNQLVIDRSSMEELGRVEVLWMYPQAHRVLGFVCRSGFLGGKKTAFKLPQIAAIGESSILTNGAAEETDASKVRQLESLLQAEIWSDTGDRIGKITDFLFNPKTGAITQYLFVSSGWSGIMGELYQLTPPQIRSFGNKRVLVPAAIAQKLELYREGITQKITKVTAGLQEEATEELESLTQQVEAVTEQTRERLQDLTEQARERSQSLTDRAKTRVQQFNDRFKERLEHAKETSQVLVEQVKERSQLLSEQVEEGIQTLTVQAKEILDPTDAAPVEYSDDDWDFLDDDDFGSDDAKESRSPADDASSALGKTAPGIAVEPIRFNDFVAQIDSPAPEDNFALGEPMGEVQLENMDGQSPVGDDRAIGSDESPSPTDKDDSADEDDDPWI